MKYIMIAGIGFTIWIAENIYFGFNKDAQSGVEMLLDNISILIIFWGIFGDLTSGLSITKVANIKTDKEVNVIKN